MVFAQLHGLIAAHSRMWTRLLPAEEAVLSDILSEARFRVRVADSHCQLTHPAQCCAVLSTLHAAKPLLSYAAAMSATSWQPLQRVRETLCGRQQLQQLLPLFPARHMTYAALQVVAHPACGAERLEQMQPQVWRPLAGSREHVGGGQHLCVTKRQ